MITTFTEPCWFLVLAGTTTEYHGPHEGSPHFDTEAEALASDTALHAKDHDKTVGAVPFNRVCHLIVCNDCAAEPDDDEWSSVHWGSLAEAQSMVSVFDFVLVGERDVWCDDCKTNPHQHVGADEALCGRCGGFADEHEPATAEVTS
jgi:hypothetical protein